MRFPTLDEFTFGIDFVGLPLCAALPPSATARSIVAETVLPSVVAGIFEVTTDDVLEGVSYFVSCGDDVLGGCGVEIERSCFEIDTRAVGSPCGRVVDKDGDLVGLECFGGGRVCKAKL